MAHLILFAGLHKTGSTSIQNFCVLNQGLLNRNGLFYSPWLQVNGQFTDEGDGNHTRLLRNAFKRAPPPSFGSPTSYAATSATFRDGLHKLLQRSGNRAVLMAAEAVSTFTAPELEAMDAWFRERNFGIKLFCCIRKPLEWLTSFVAQRASGRLSPRITIEAAIQEFVVAGGIIVPRIQNLAQTFPTANFYSFESATQHLNGPAGYFLEKIGVEIDKSFTVVKANEGSSEHAVRLHSMINQFIGPRGASMNNEDFYRMLPHQLPALWTIPGEKFALTQDEIAPLQSMLAQENAWLQSEFGPGFHDTELVMGNGRASLDSVQRKFLIKHFSTAEMPVAQIVQRYLAEHGAA